MWELPKKLFENILKFKRETSNLSLLAKLIMLSTTPLRNFEMWPLQYLYNWWRKSFVSCALHKGRFGFLYQRLHKILRWTTYADVATIYDDMMLSWHHILWWYRYWESISKSQVVFDTWNSLGIHYFSLIMKSILKTKR